MENKNYLTVTALNKYIAKKFEVDPYLVEIYIKGEISNFKIHNNNNLYFSIKDENTRINAVQFGSSKIDFKDGDTVLIKAKINYYFPRGEHNLLVLDMKKDTIGELYQKFLELQKKLQDEGLFLPQYKKQLPKLSNNIAVVTAATGAAVQDIKRTIQRRYPIANITIYSTLVQGQGSVEDIVNKLWQADNDDNDVIILARGGGSIEDLWSFNSEEVVRAIFSCTTPVVTGVGHETDTTLADFVADRRASTPTAAAELVTPNIEDIKNNLRIINKKINDLLALKIQNSRLAVEKNVNSYYIKNYSAIYENYRKYLEQLENNMKTILENELNIKKINFSNKKQVFLSLDILARFKNIFSSKIGELEANSPMNILNKGYAIAFKDNEKISSVTAVEISDKIDVKVQDGVLNCQVLNISKKEK